MSHIDEKKFDELCKKIDDIHKALSNFDKSFGTIIDVYEKSFKNFSSYIGEEKSHSLNKSKLFWQAITFVGGIAAKYLIDYFSTGGA